MGYQDRLLASRENYPFAQVEPVRWSEKRQRKVLNAAVCSVVTSEMIRAATFAVNTGYSGSLSRRTSSRQDVSAFFRSFMCMVVLLCLRPVMLCWACATAVCCALRPAYTSICRSRRCLARSNGLRYPVFSRV